MIPTFLVFQLRTCICLQYIVKAGLHWLRGNAFKCNRLSILVMNDLIHSAEMGTAVANIHNLLSDAERQQLKA